MSVEERQCRRSSLHKVEQGKKRSWDKQTLAPSKSTLWALPAAVKESASSAAAAFLCVSGVRCLVDCTYSTGTLMSLFYG
jgi:hypothetical protein